jgi:hypothetical protein
MKHKFKFGCEPTKHLIDRLVEMCTVDGSVVDKIKIDYSRLRGLGNDLVVTIWTKKGK